jgi:hypothetical protein
VLDPIRIATIVAPGLENAVNRFMSDFQRPHRPNERRDYLPTFPGFSTVFGVRLLESAAVSRIVLPSAIDAELESSKRPHLVLADRLTKALATMEQVRTEFDMSLSPVLKSHSRAARMRTSIFTIT